MRKERESGFGRGLKIFGTVLMFAMGILITTQSNLGIYAESDPDFLKWLRAMGIAVIFHSIVLFAAHVLGFAKEKESMAIGIIFNAIYMVMIFWLFRSPEIVPVIAFTEGQAFLMEDSEVTHFVVRVILGSILLFMGISIIQSLGILIFHSRKKR